MTVVILEIVNSLKTNTRDTEENIAQTRIFPFSYLNVE